MTFARFFAFLNPVAAYAKAKFLALTQQDGKTGLSDFEFNKVVGWVKEQAAGLLSSREKAEAVANKVNDAFGHRIAPWTLHLLVSAAYDFAANKGLLKTKP